MSAELWPCSTCGAAGVLNLGTRGYCTTHASEILRSFDPSVWSLRGRWIQTGCLRPDHGPGYAECECPACGAGAVVLVGSRCAYCEVIREKLAVWQASRVLTPPDCDIDDARRPAALEAWAERMVTAAEAGIITASEAHRAWDRALGERHAA
ncbi:MAG TPA: hypothetical protein VNQ73_14410 [Ilumatobacter sp.]|nr:hypothetical protein [Ilumatobacter sp.]